MIELMIVMIVLAILAAVAVPTFLRSKQGARYRDAQTTAMAYQGAIAQYSTDHFGLPPLFSSSTQWGANGPINNLLGGTTPYMKAAPPTTLTSSAPLMVLQGSTLNFSATGTVSAPTPGVTSTAYSYITYYTSPAASGNAGSKYYLITVYTTKKPGAALVSSNLVGSCALTNGAIPTDPVTSSTFKLCK